MVAVPELAQKINALVKLTRIGTRTALAAHFGISERALGYWEGEKPGAEAGVPDRHYTRFMDLLVEHIPGVSRPEDAKRLVHGPLREFTAALLSSSDGNWSRFIQRIDGEDRLKIMIKGVGAAERSRRTAFGPARLDIPASEDLVALPAGTRFRLEMRGKIRTSAPCETIVLQYENGIWDPLPLMADTYVTRLPVNQLSLPVAKRAERDWYALNGDASDEIAFAVLVSQAFPHDITDTVSQGLALEGTTLDRLAYLLERDAPNKRDFAAIRCRVLPAKI